MEFKTFQNLSKLFHKRGYDVFLVGGCVRDYLLYQTINDADIDVATNAPLEVMKTFLLFIKEFPKMESGTILFENTLIDITRMRKELDYHDFRHPNHIIPTDIVLEDAKRRDFTSNAIYLNDKKKLIDPFNGKKDLDDKILRMIGDPNIRLQEDPLRILRAIRIAHIHHLTMEEELLKAIDKQKHFLKRLNYHKVVEELKKFDLEPQEVRDILEQYHIEDVLPLYYEFNNKIILDLHNNVISKMYLDNSSFVHNSLFFDLTKMQILSQIGQVFALTIPLKTSEEHYNYLLKEIEFYHQTIKEHKFFIEEALSSNDFEKIKSKNKRVAILAIDEKDILKGHLNRLDELYKLGVRIIKFKKKRFFLPDKNNDEFGLKVIKRMNELGMIIDVSSLPKEDIKVVLNASKKPIITYYPIDDEEFLTLLKEKEALMGVNDTKGLTEYFFNKNATNFKDLITGNRSKINQLLIGFYSNLDSFDDKEDAYMGYIRFIKSMDGFLYHNLVEKIGYKNFLKVWKANENP